MKRRTIITISGALTLSLAAVGCDRLEQEQIEAVEQQAEANEALLDRREEADKELAEGQAKAAAAARGKGELAEALAGSEARARVDKRYEALEDEQERAVEARKAAIKAAHDNE